MAGRRDGYSRTFHDHFTVPSPEVADEDRELFMRMSPAFKERFQRYQIAYHGGGAFLSDADHLLVGYHIEEAVFAPLYYGYGGRGQYAERSAFARHIEQDIMKEAPDTIMVLLTARAGGDQGSNAARPYAARPEGEATGNTQRRGR